MPAFLAAIAAVTRPGGLVVLSTLSRTAASFLKAIVGAEYVLGWLPRGTHDWRRFLTPAELGRRAAQRTASARSMSAASAMTARATVSR